MQEMKRTNGRRGERTRETYGETFDREAYGETFGETLEALFIVFLLGLFLSRVYGFVYLGLYFVKTEEGKMAGHTQ